MAGNTLISTRTGPLTLALATNSTRTGTSVVQPADRTDPPAAVATAGAEVAVMDMNAGGPTLANGVWIKPFGTDTAAETFLMAVFGWRYIPGDQASVLGAWTATLLAGFTCTLSTSAKGVVNAAVNASQFYCDTIAMITNQGTANVSNECVSPTSNLAGHVLVDAKGSNYLDLRFWRNASAVSCNALWAPI